MQWFWPGCALRCAGAVTVCTPLPAPAVTGMDHDDLLVLDLAAPLWAPVTSTHWVVLSVVTVRVSTSPALA